MSSLKCPCKTFYWYTSIAAAEFICHEKIIHVYINVKDRRAARKE